jgi:hypothetical protein
MARVGVRALRCRRGGRSIDKEINHEFRVARCRCTVYCLASGAASAQSALHVYGPGGPAPAMKEAATEFEKKTGTHVDLTAGPTPTWIDHARQDADIIYSGSETMMSDFVVAMVDPDRVKTPRGRNDDFTQSSAGVNGPIWPV